MAWYDDQNLRERELVRLLRLLEWSGTDSEQGLGHFRCCPECGYPKPDSGNAGHSWYCQLSQCLDYYEGKFNEGDQM